MNLSRHLIPLVDRLDSATIACVGDLMLDHFIYGDVNRISPEAPIPVLRVRSQRSMLGGLGNVVRNLGALGCGIQVFSATGADESSSEIETLLQKVPRCESHVIRESGRTTPVKLRYVANNQQLLRADQESSDAISTESMEALLTRFRNGIAECAVVILSDYAKGVLVNTLAAHFIEIALSQGKQVIVDPKGSDFTRYRRATVIKPNLKELADATGSSVSSAAEQEEAARQLIRQTEAQFLLVTRGPDGMLLVPQAGEALPLPSLAREVFDVSGAGDTVAATLAAGLASGASIADAVNMANIAAGLVVAKAGTATVSRVEIMHQIESQSAILTNEKLLTEEQLIERSSLWRRLGMKVGLVVGAMDVLSPADLQKIEMARKSCDWLVIAVIADSTLKQRPSAGVKADQRARAYLAASLVYSDSVFIHENETAERLMLLLEPAHQCFL